MSDAREERLLELLLERDPAAAAELARLRAEPGVLESLAGLEELLAATRAALAAGAPAAADSERVAAAVLARSTREDLSWRGELRLVRGYLTDRLRSSILLRVAAASLLLHLVAVPVVAWVVLRPRWRPETELRFEPAEILPENLVAAPDAEQPLALELPDPETLLDGEGRAAQGGPAPDAVANALRRARFLLGARQVVPPPLGDPGPEADGLKIRLLRARSLGTHEGRWDPILDDAAAAGRADAAERVLWAEALLDRYALEGTAPAALPVLLRAMELEGGDLGALERGVLDRSARYGLLDQSDRVRWAGVLRRLEQGPRRDAPVDRAWIDHLDRVLEAAGVAGPVREAWSAWDPGSAR